MPDTTPRFVWSDPHGKGRNRYTLFRRSFTLEGDPVAGEIHLFADTRYRLLVNGHTVGHGPARFYLKQPEYDTHDLAPYLQRGENVVALIVNSTGVVSFHSEASVGGLIAWGEASDDAGHTVALATTPGSPGDEHWKAVDSPGHDPDTPALSFALNPGEQLDARAMPDGWDRPGFDAAAWPAAVPHENPTHWGDLQPRSIPLLDERADSPERLLSAWKAHYPADETVYSLRVTASAGEGRYTRGKVGVFAYLHSPRAQQVRLGAWWGRHFVNGVELKGDKSRGERARRQDFTAQLNEGWNTLLVVEDMRHDTWQFFLALPKDAGVTVAAEKDLNTPDAFLIGGPWENEAAEAANATDWPVASPGDLAAPLDHWRPWPRSQTANRPFYERAWKEFERIGDSAEPGIDLAPYTSRLGPGDSLSLVFDFGREVLGRPRLDFTAAPGTTVDLSYNERLLEGGLPDVHFRYHVDMIERYTTREGRQQIHTFHPRGFRYLEVLVTGDLSRFRIHRLEATRANYPVKEVGRFRCSDPVLNAAWDLGIPTLKACMEDAYLDCPHRERGQYVGDMLAEYAANRGAFGDVALYRRSMEIFWLGQGDNGLIRPGAHGLPPGRHPDYSAIMPQVLWEYYATTGDKAITTRYLPHLGRLLKGLDAFAVTGTDLLDGSDLKPYIDLSHLDKQGISCALNCFYQRAFADSARVYDALGHKAEADACRERADRLAAAIRDAFWDDARGVFLDRRRGDVPETGPSVPGNALALLYDIATPDQARRAVAWVADAMLHNFRSPAPERNEDCNVTSYFSFYALGAIYKHGLHAEAAAFMRRYWGYMLDQGAWTCWEYFADKGSQSYCHAWSASPTWYLPHQVLGVKQPVPGQPNKVAIEPGIDSGLDWAEGVYPHPAGPIHVSWRRRGSGVELNYTLPDGVELVENPHALS